MPRTRSHLDRETKRTELLDAAERRVLAGGYDELSLAALARDLDLAQNSIYWYFESKDALFVAVLERLLERVVLPPREASLDLRRWVLDVIDRLADLQQVRASARQRASRSPVVADFEARFRSKVHALLVKAFAHAAPATTLDVAVEAFMATADGAVQAHIDRHRRRELLTYALDRLLPA